MEKEKKTIIYVMLVIILSSILVSVALGPRIIQSEMREYKNDARVQRPNDSLIQKAYYRIAGGNEIKYSSYYNDSPDVDCIVKENTKCLARAQVEILSTQNDQNLLSRIIQKEYRADFEAGRINIEYKDINSDGVEDLLVYQAKHPKNGIFYQNIFFYSAHNNRVLWQITDQYDDFYQPLLDVRFVKSNIQPPMIVVYNGASRPNYKFYKSVRGKYSLTDPSTSNWSDYWATIPTTTLIERYLGVWGLMTVIGIAFYALVFLTIVILITIIIRAIKRKKILVEPLVLSYMILNIKAYLMVRPDITI